MTRVRRVKSQSAEAAELAFPTALSRRLPLIHLPLRVSERRLLLGLLDVTALTLGLLVVLWLRLGHDFSFRLLWERPLWFGLLILLWMPLAVAFDAYELRTASRWGSSVASVLKAGGLTLVIYLLIPYVTPHLVRSRLTIFLFVAVGLAFLASGRSAYSLALAQPAFQRRVLIIGAGWAGRTILDAIQEYGNGLYQVVGFIDDDPAKQGLSIHSPHTQESFPVLGNRRSIKSLASSKQISALVLAITHEVNGELLQILMDCLELGVEVIPMPVLYEQLTGRVPIEHIGDNWYVAMPIQHPGSGALYPLLKRLMDIVLASIGLLFLGLATPFIALAIYLDSPGPIFYTQERVGKGGRIFKVYKFRTMVPDAEKGKAVWARENDPRVTRVGRFLRKTHVDEFPQFLNILKGEMSAVGPRPERPEFVEELAREIPFYRVRHAVKPGMAGWALVKYGYASSKEDAAIKLQYDLYYIKHQSLWLDVVILIKTIVDTLTLRGRA